MRRNNISCYIFQRLRKGKKSENGNQQKKGGKGESLRQRLLSAERRLPSVFSSTTKWDLRQECKAIRRMHTGAFCGATKPTLLTTTTSEAKKYPHRQSRRVYPVERGNAAILRRHPYYLLLTMMVLRLCRFRVATHHRKREWALHFHANCAPDLNEWISD